MLRRSVTLFVALALLGGACGQTSEDQNNANHQFNDAVVLDARPQDGGGQGDGGPTTPACQDGLDNDGDGLIDYPDDPGCISASDEDESNPPYCGLTSAGEMIEIRTLPPTGHIVQSTDNGSNHHAGSCGGDGAWEMVFKLTVLGDTSGVLISTIGAPTLLDTVIYVRKDTCDATDTEVACGFEPGGGGSALALDDPAPGDYYIFVDGQFPATSGQFLLTVQGLIPEGAPCDPTDQTLVCTPGLICVAPPGGPPTRCLVPLCSDGLDNDGDGIIDWPNEPGCETALDHTEEDTCPGVGCPQCADQIDNDGDGLTDWPADPGCSGAGDPVELDECLPGLTLTDLPANGTATGAIDDAAPSLTAGSCSSYSGPETVYPLALPYGAVTVDIALGTTTTYANLYVRQQECRDGTELGCSGGYSYSTSLHLTHLAPGSYFIFADTQDIWQSDTHTLTVAVKLPVGAPCAPSNPLAQCAPGGTCDASGTGHLCMPTVCNNGIDDDSDGLTDYPEDPGCAHLDDTDEADTCDASSDPASCPTCANGLDDDGDGLIDYPNDPGCQAASDTNELDECFAGVPLEQVPLSGTVNGTLLDSAPSFADPSCVTGTGAERVYLIDLPLGAVSLAASLSSGDIDPTLYIRHGDCPSGAELSCHSTWSEPATASLHDIPPGQLFIFVDAAYFNTSPAAYTLTVSVALPAGAPCVPSSPLHQCGNGGTCLDVGGGVFQCVGATCDNGIDDDGDGYVDYPDDPGCQSPSDFDEADSCDATLTPQFCPKCFNGIDDDGDGLIDYPNDPGCESAGDNDEVDECGAGVLLTDLTLTGHAVGLPSGVDVHSGSCTSWSGYPEDVFVVRLPGPAAQLHATLQGNANFQPVLYVRRDSCESTPSEIGCDAAQSPDWDFAELTLTNVAAGNIYVFADSDYQWSSGQYTLDVSATLQAGAACDASSSAVLCPSGTTCSASGAGLRCQ